MVDAREAVKAQAKLALGGVLAISPEMYGEFIDALAETHPSLTVEAIRAAVAESLRELPPYLD